MVSSFQNESNSLNPTTKFLRNPTEPQLAARRICSFVPYWIPFESLESIRISARDRRRAKWIDRWSRAPICSAPKSLSLLCRISPISLRRGCSCRGLPPPPQPFILGCPRRQPIVALQKRSPPGDVPCFVVFYGSLQKCFKCVKPEVQVLELSLALFRRFDA